MFTLIQSFFPDDNVGSTSIPSIANLVGLIMSALFFFEGLYKKESIWDIQYTKTHVNTA